MTPYVDGSIARAQWMGIIFGTLWLGGMHHPAAHLDPSEGKSFIADVPEELARDEDMFGHADYAEALASALAATPSPFTVALFGDWGVGKSTIVKMLATYLPSTTRLSVFDAWRFEGVALRRAFLKVVAADVARSGRLVTRRTADRLRRDLDADTTGSQSRVRLDTLLLVKTLCESVFVGGAIYLGLSWLRQHGLPVRAQTAGAVGALASLVTYGALLVRRLLPIGGETITMHRLDEPDRFAERFLNLLANSPYERIVIAVDNVDRCDPVQAVQLLSTIKTYLEPALNTAPYRTVQTFTQRSASYPNVSFLITADYTALRQQILTAGLSAALIDVSGSQTVERFNPDQYVDEYLRKFFAARLTVRELLDEDFRDYARPHVSALLTRWEGRMPPERLASETELAVSMLGSALRANPRRVNHFLNSLELELRLLRARQRAGHLEPTFHLNLLFVLKLALVRDEWPALYRMVLRHPPLLEDWRRRDDHSRGITPEVADAEWERFVKFLEDSREVQEQELLPYLLGKHQHGEKWLPISRDLRSALDERRIEDVDRILRGFPASQQRDYADLFVRLMRRDLASERSGQAAVIVAVACNPGFFSHFPLAQWMILRLAHSSDSVIHELLLHDRPWIDSVFDALLQLEPINGRLLGRIAARALALKRPPKGSTDVLQRGFMRVARELNEVVAEGVREELKALRRAAPQAKGISAVRADFSPLGSFVDIFAANPLLAPSGAGR